MAAFGFISKGGNDKNGYQIDLIIDGSDNAINLCEMKFYQTELLLSKSEAERIKQRREDLRTETGTKKYLFTTLITTYGLIDHVITMDQLF